MPVVPTSRREEIGGSARLVGVQGSQELQVQGEKLSMDKGDRGRCTMPSTNLYITHSRHTCAYTCTQTHTYPTY